MLLSTKRPNRWHEYFLQNSSVESVSLQHPEAWSFHGLWAESCQSWQHHGCSRLSTWYYPRKVWTRSQRLHDTRSIETTSGMWSILVRDLNRSMSTIKTGNELFSKKILSVNSTTRSFECFVLSARKARRKLFAHGHGTKFLRWLLQTLPWFTEFELESPIQSNSYLHHHTIETTPILSNLLHKTQLPLEELLCANQYHEEFSINGVLQALGSARIPCSRLRLELDFSPCWFSVPIRDGQNKWVSPVYPPQSVHSTYGSVWTKRHFGIRTKFIFLSLSESTWKRFSRHSPTWHLSTSALPIFPMRIERDWQRRNQDRLAA